MSLFLSAKAGKYELIESLLNNSKGAFWIGRIRRRQKIPGCYKKIKEKKEWCFFRRGDANRLA